MATITKKQLTDRVAKAAETPRVLVKKVLQHLLDAIIEELAKGNRLEFRDFGVFEVRPRGARLAHNPRTGERVPVREKQTVKFKVGRLMRQRVQQARRSGSVEPRAARGASHPPPA
jgi:integration host factor subunit beta